MSVRTLSFCQDSQVSVRTLKFACQDSQVYVRTAPSGRFRRGRARSKGGLGVYHSLLGGRGRRVAVKEGGGLVGGTCEHCEDRAPSGPRQDSVRTLSGPCQDSVRTLSGLSGQVREVHKPGYRAISRTLAPAAVTVTVRAFLCFPVALSLRVWPKYRFRSGPPQILISKFRGAAANFEVDFDCQNVSVLAQDRAYRRRTRGCAGTSRLCPLARPFCRERAPAACKRWLAAWRPEAAFGGVSVRC